RRPTRTRLRAAQPPRVQRPHRTGTHHGKDHRRSGHLTPKLPRTPQTAPPRPPRRLRRQPRPCSRRTRQLLRPHPTSRSPRLRRRTPQRRRLHLHTRRQSQTQRNGKTTERHRPDRVNRKRSASIPMSGREGPLKPESPDTSRREPTKMRGSITKKGSRWYVVLDLGRDQAGSRKRKWHGGYVTKREAERVQAKLVHELDMGIYSEPSQVKVADYLRDWLAAKPNLAQTTREGYQRELKRIIK